MKKTDITKEELIIFEKLLIKNRDDHKLQNITDCSYSESINLLNKIRSIITDIEINKNISGCIKYRIDI
jgi:hypothetical protein